jgi:hypothetical protein
MRAAYVSTGWTMTLREQSRSRIALVLLFIIPTLFYLLVAATTTQRAVPFKLAALAGEPVVAVSEQHQALVFIGLAAVGLLTAFLAMTLVQQHTHAHQRLVLAGYRPSELVFAKLGALAVVITSVSLYVGAMILLFFRPERFELLLAGFALEGYVYGCYGLLVGTIVRRELEGILLVVLLANIDVGWLQNPLFYAEAQNQVIIRALPAFFPSQVSMIAAFTDHAVTRPLLGGFAYGTVLLALATLLYWLRMRIYR